MRSFNIWFELSKWKQQGPHTWLCVGTRRRPQTKSQLGDQKSHKLDPKDSPDGPKAHIMVPKSVDMAPNELTYLTLCGHPKTTQNKKSSTWPKLSRNGPQGLSKLTENAQSGTQWVPKVGKNILPGKPHDHGASWGLKLGAINDRKRYQTEAQWCQKAHVSVGNERKV